MSYESPYIMRHVHDARHSYLSHTRQQLLFAFIHFPRSPTASKALFGAHRIAPTTCKMAAKRKLWQEAMKAAVAFVPDGNSLRHAARLYNEPVETLRRRVNGTVTLDCKPGPSTMLTKEEEQCLAKYVIEMADRGFGLQSEDLMQSGRPNPFCNGMAGKGWLEAFRKSHPELSLRPPQAVSYSRAASASKLVVDDFFPNLGGLYRV